MSRRASFYSTGYFQRGGVPLATFPARVMYPSDGFGFKTLYVSSNPHFVTSPYGDPYGGTSGYLKSVFQIRYSRTNLQERKANVSTYDHYDAISSMIDAGRSYSDIEAFPNYSSFTALASNDSAALLKTGYWLAVAFLALNDTSLRDAAKERIESGFNSGVDIDAANRNSSIKSTYDSAYALLDKAIKRKGGSNEVATDALEQLRRGTDRKAVQSRVDEAKSQAGQRQQAEDAPPPKKTDIPCTDGWKSYIPGLCAAETAAEMAAVAAKIVGVVLVGGVAVWGVKRLIRQAKANPLSDSYNPEKKKPMPALADKQEAHLARTVFRKRSA